MKDIDRSKCLRCGGTMEHAGSRCFQLGSYGLLTGNWSHLFSGSMDAEIYICPDCGKLELYAPGIGAPEGSTPMKACPECGHMHEAHYPRCPKCRHQYDE